MLREMSRRLHRTPQLQRRAITGLERMARDHEALERCFRDASALELFGCSEKQLARHIRDVLRDARPDGLTMDELCQQVSYRTTKDLVEGMVRAGNLVQLECGSCYLPSSGVSDVNTACSNPDCEALVKEAWGHDGNGTTAVDPLARSSTTGPVQPQGRRRCRLRGSIPLLWMQRSCRSAAFPGDLFLPCETVKPHFRRTARPTQ